MMRVVLFLITNMAVVFLFGMVMFFVHIQLSNVVNLLIISIIIGFCGSVISLFLSKYIALFSVHGKILKKATTDLEDWLLCIIRDQSRKLNIVMPDIVVYDAYDMNAFATGSCKNSSLVALSTGLLENMTYDEIEAVIAHEMSHISNGDMVTMTLIQGVINTFVIFVSRFLVQLISYGMSLLFSNEDSEDVNDNHYFLESNSSVYYFVSLMLELVFGILANVVVLWFSRNREFYADAGSAKLVGVDKMIAVLEKLKLSCEPKESNMVLSFCINSVRTNNIFGELFMSHPSLDRRIEVLRSGDYLNKSSFFHGE